MCQEKDHKEHDRTKDKNSPVKSDQKSNRCRDPLSAAESKVDRKVMTKDTACCRIDCKQRHDISGRVTEAQSHDHDRQHTFEAVAKKRHRAGFFAKRAQGIGGSCIATSMFTDICLMHLSNNIRSLKQSKNITYQKAYQTFSHFIQLFSPRSRIINFSGVPWKPNASLTLFSM